MKILLTSDHAGFSLKNALLEHLQTLGHEVEDMGPYALDPADDYPDYVTPLATRIAEDAESYGIVCAGSGQGEVMCANRISGVRAALFYGKIRATGPLEIEGGQGEDGYDIVRVARRHNNANVLCLGTRFISVTEADEAVRMFLTTPFATDPRHARRLAKF
jgi:ribose 5-phosphate isomerase B